MALGIFVAPLMKAGEYLVQPIGRQVNYLRCYDTNVKNFQKQVEKLVDMRDIMQQSVSAATRNGEETRIDVKKWLTNVDRVLAEAEGFNDELNLNRRCFNAWCPNWMLRYKFSKEATKKTAIIVELQGNGRFGNVSVPVLPPSILFLLTNDLVNFESTESTIDQILEALQDDKCDIVGVHGMGGIGKTTLVKEVGKRAQELNLFDKVVMAVVSKTPDLRKVQGQLADILGLKFSEETEIGRAGRLYERLKYEKRILIILDDIWTSINLAAVGLPHGEEHNGCKIILTTRREQACSAMGDNMKKVPVKLLSTEESWDLFRNYVGAVIDRSPIRGVAMEVARECQGLPLALVTVGRALRGKGLVEWEAALGRLKMSKSVTIDDEDGGVFSCLRLSYEYLRSDEMKLCFLLCCLFPEDHEIPIEDLARLAMGKRLFSDVDTMEEARRQTHQTLMYLKASCLLLDSDKEGCVKMHDMVRDLAISIASGDIDRKFLVRAGVGLEEWPNKESFEDYMCISLMTNDIKKLPVGLNCPKLQILLMGENEGFEEFPDAFLRDMTRLRVLDLSERVGIRSLLPDDAASISSRPVLTLPPSLQMLIHLRTLHLNRCKLDNLSILGRLEKLEILSFYGSDITVLPKEIGELSHLRLLDLSFCQYLRTIPPNVISRLLQLEELYMGGSFRRWAIEGTTDQEGSNASLSELRSLPRLSILCVELRNIACLPNSIFLHRLLKFEVTIGSDSIKCYPNSRSLYLREIETPIPNEITTLFPSIKELTFFCLKDMNVIPDIDPCGLNALKLLEVRACESMFSLINTDDWSPPVIFAALEELHLWHLDNIDIICRGRGSLPTGSLQKLRVLKVESCRKFNCDLLPFELFKMFQGLEEVTISRCENVMFIFIFPRPRIEERRTGEKEHAALSPPRKLRRERRMDKEEHAPLFPLRKLRRERRTDEEEYAPLSPLRKWRIEGRMDKEEHAPLSALRKLRLEALPRLYTIWKFHSEPLASLHNLTVVEIRECRDLKFLFPHSIAQSLQQLEILKIGWCQTLGSIVAKEEKEDDGIYLIKAVRFPKLKVVQVEGCPNLTCLFSMTTGRSLWQLKEITIIKCKQLVEIISRGNEGGDEEILLPEVNSFQVRDLPRLKRLCSERFSLNLPALKELVVEWCPMMGSFAADATAYGLRGASKLVKLQIDGQMLNATAIQQLFSGKGRGEINQHGKSEEMKPLLRYSS